MKYSVHDYAKALDQAISDPKGDADAIGKRFLALVRQNGDGAKLEKILEAAARLSRGKGEVRQVIIESARKLSKPQEAVVKRFIKSGDVIEYAEDPDLVAGIKVVVNDEMQFDGTMKAKLDALFSAN